MVCTKRGKRRGSVFLTILPAMLPAPAPPNIYVPTITAPYLRAVPEHARSQDSVLLCEDHHDGLHFQPYILRNSRGYERGASCRCIDMRKCRNHRELFFSHPNPLLARRFAAFLLDPLSNGYVNR